GRLECLAASTESARSSPNGSSLFATTNPGARVVATRYVTTHETSGLALTVCRHQLPCLDRPETYRVALHSAPPREQRLTTTEARYRKRNAPQNRGLSECVVPS